MKRGRSPTPRRPIAAGSSWPIAGRCLLDEISEMPLNLQSKLLRVIQEREFERVGSSADDLGRRAHHRDLEPQPERVHRGRAVP